MQRFSRYKLLLLAPLVLVLAIAVACGSDDDDVAPAAPAAPSAPAVAQPTALTPDYWNPDTDFYGDPV